MKDKTILVVDGDKTNAQNIIKSLKGEGYNAFYVESAQEAIDTCIKKIIDLIILELNLEDKDGMVVIDTIRSFTNTLPIIVVSNRSNVESKVMALDTGANDYLTKPFNIYELLARIRNQFRYIKEDKQHLFINGNLTIDFDAKTIFINGVEVHFTNFEYKIVVLLAMNLGKTLSYDYIISHVWGKDGNDQNGLRVFMAGIRRKIEKDSRSSKLIRTDIGVGYRMNKVI
jgi:Response regulators consisting of a CheY-like receiver domain and a winged-helix DNA-binding domain